MISVIIPTLNAERTLAHALAALVPAVVEGIVQEAILVDGGSTDETCAIAEAAGTQLIEAPRGRGSQLEAGARHAQRRLAALSARRHGARAWLGRGGAELHRAGRERQASPGRGVVQLRARR